MNEPETNRLGLIPLAQSIGEIHQHGFSVLSHVFSGNRIKKILGEIENAFDADQSQASLRTSRQTVFAARNLIDMLPNLSRIWQVSALTSLLREVLGNNFGLVRVLYFDKPSHRSWTLPWHKDMTIAVQDNQLGGTHFCKPTTKAGVPHVEASVANKSPHRCR